MDQGQANATQPAAGVLGKLTRLVDLKPEPRKTLLAERQPVLLESGDPSSGSRRSPLPRRLLRAAAAGLLGSIALRRQRKRELCHPFSRTCVEVSKTEAWFW